MLPRLRFLRSSSFGPALLVLLAAPLVACAHHPSGDLLAGVSALASSPRSRTLIDHRWRFHAGELASGASPSLDDTSWTQVELPHTWNSEDAFDDEPGYRRGAGWYRRRLDLDPRLLGKRLFLFFEGANQVADVFVNGIAAGHHTGGYTAFIVDVTSLVEIGGTNVLAVRVDNSPDPAIPPLDADFTFYGGLYRDVWLLATDPIHIDVTDHASPGVFIDTPSVSAELATVRIRGTVVNEDRRAADVGIQNQLIDPEGGIVASSSSSVRIAPGESHRFIQTIDSVAHPRLWSPDDPNVYRIRTIVRDGSRIADITENPFGFRWFAIDSDTGYSLNGRPLRLAGTNRHQDRAGYANALRNDQHREDVSIIRENGFNFLRLAHYPQDPAVLQATDELGLVVWEEIPVVNMIGMSDAFARNCRQMLREMIRQHYNHPSILFWGTANEVLLRKPDPIPDGYYEALVTLVGGLDALAREEDATRATAMALSIAGIRNDRGIADIPDVIGLNLYFGWYYERLDSLGPFLDELHAKRPELAIVISEYGAGSDRRVHSLHPVAFDFSSELAQQFHRSAFPQIEARPYLTGSAVWNQFDFGSELRSDTIPAINQKGLWFHDRTPKDVAWYYRAALDHDPVLRIAREWSERAGSTADAATQPVWVYTNLDSVELFVDGASAGVHDVVNRVAEWNVRLREGVNELRAVGKRGSLSVDDQAGIRYADRHLRFRSEERGVVVAVNAGAAYSYTDAGGVVWEADRPYVQGEWGFMGGEPVRTHHRIAQTDDDALFQSSREGMSRYRFDVSPGRYEVTLGFAETTDPGRGDRTFDVRIGGEEVLSAFDPVGAAGIRLPLTRTYVAEVGERGLSIDFIARNSRPSVASILLRRL